jgi:hypothetical protein
LIFDSAPFKVQRPIKSKEIRERSLKEGKCLGLGAQGSLWKKIIRGRSFRILEKNSGIRQPRQLEAHSCSP